MEVHRLDSAEEFLDRCRGFLVEKEAENNLILGLITEQIGWDRYDEQRLFVVDAGSGPALAALQTPPHNLVVSTCEQAAALHRLAEAIAAGEMELPGVTGPSDEARAFAQSWTQRLGRGYSELMSQRIFKLAEVRPPAGVDGRLRAAEESDIPTLGAWLEAFSEEAAPDHEPRPAEEVQARAEGFMKHPDRKAYLWDDDGSVSMAAHSGPTPNGIRVSAVYTPPEKRRRGYASACVAALSQRLLDEGRRFCFLYTDLANPTSNHIYTEIGYEPVCDSVMLSFEAT